MLNVERKNLGTVSLLNLDGNVVIGETDTLRDVVETLPSNSSVVLDLSHVSLVDAHGLGFLRSPGSARRTSGSASPTVRNSLRRSGPGHLKLRPVMVNGA